MKRAIDMTRTQPWITGAATILITSMLVLVRSYLGLKLFFVASLLLAVLYGMHRKTLRIVVYRRMAWFYLLIGTAGLVWAFVGLLHSSNYVQGVFESLKLYVLWSAAFLALYTILRAAPLFESFITPWF